jgi:hypothetical protein
MTLPLAAELTDQDISEALVEGCGSVTAWCDRGVVCIACSTAEDTMRFRSSGRKRCTL